MTEDCPICYDSLGTHGMETTLRCSHSFCKDCIGAWSKNNNTCPLCRKCIHLIDSMYMVKVAFTLTNYVLHVCLFLTSQIRWFESPSFLQECKSSHLLATMCVISLLTNPVVFYVLFFAFPKEHLILFDFDSVCDNPSAFIRMAGLHVDCGFAMAGMVAVGLLFLWMWDHMNDAREKVLALFTPLIIMCRTFFELA